METVDRIEEIEDLTIRALASNDAERQALLVLQLISEGVIQLHRIRDLLEKK